MTQPESRTVEITIHEALTNEDEIAHGEAVKEGPDGYVRLGVCAYCDDHWPCRTQRGIDRLLLTLAAAKEHGLVIGEEWRHHEPRVTADWTMTCICGWIGTEDTDDWIEHIAAATKPTQPTHPHFDPNLPSGAHYVIDKAIAEAPDSPRGPEAALLLEAYDDVALSEKPGLDDRLVRRS